MNILPLSVRVATVGFLAAMSLGASETGGEKIKLWPNGAPFDDARKQGDQVDLIVSRPARPNGTTIIICPGGGYGQRCIDTEGYNVAKWLNEHGVTTAILEYRLPSGRCEVPLSDAQRAIRWVRANASAWKIKPDRIGIIGFSAGGHLASTADTHFDLGTAKSADPVERVSCRPDFAMLIYPVITMGEKTHGGSRGALLGGSPTPEQIRYYSSELQVSDQTPPTFIAHAKDDGVVAVDNSRLFHAAMIAKKRSCEYLEMEHGNHGFDRQSGPAWVAMQHALLTWMSAQKLIPADQAKP